ncbi:uncharacterized protein A4U43_C07F2350 [Asparagus officinalis]|uniref:Uncharacterized protein n=1 Tax=Asparagus officinalis TaxID=4686 RepID=A0A5P1EAQ3_ASPOF|nr:uncharacterized protein A4U43_C07F2350 [Asparagus officinalis]
MKRIIRERGNLILRIECEISIKLEGINLQRRGEREYLDGGLRFCFARSHDGLSACDALELEAERKEHDWLSGGLLAGRVWNGHIGPPDPMTTSNLRNNVALEAKIRVLEEDASVDESKAVDIELVEGEPVVGGSPEVEETRSGINPRHLERYRMERISATKRAEMRQRRAQSSDSSLGKMLRTMSSESKEEEEVAMAIF